MSQDEKKSITPDEEAKLDTEVVDTSVETETPAEGDEPEEGGEVEPEVDYKAELERVKAESKRKTDALLVERSRRKAAEALARTKTNPEPEKEEPTDEDQKPTDSILERRLLALEEDKMADVLEDALDAATDDSDEKELIRYHFERLHDGSTSRRAIMAAVEDAKILANKRRFMAEAERSARKQIAQEGALRSIGGKVPTKQPKPGVQVSDADRRIAEAVGMSPEKFVKNKKRLGY